MEIYQSTPDGEFDAFIHAGDICPNYSRNWVGDGVIQINWIYRNFIPWLKNIKAKHKIIVPGNHDGVGQIFKQEVAQAIKEIGGDFLINSGVVKDGVNIWGSPYTKDIFHDGRWAFGGKDDEALNIHWELIPENTNILITHGPAFGVLDTCPRQGKRLGSKTLFHKIQSLINLELHIFGHIHGAIPTFDQATPYRVVNAAEKIEIIDF